MKKILILVGMFAMAFTGSAATVKKPSICPQWSDALPGKWTMDYEKALSSASVRGRYTLMLFTGMWWCPHCQHLEENVLTTTAWKRYVKERGFYLVAMDFPNRKGDGYWCWLWEDSYRRKAGLSAVDATREIIKRYDVQNELALDTGTYQVASNYIVTTTGSGRRRQVQFTPFEEQLTSEYTRIGYPTMLVIAPDGSVSGRFSVGLSNNDYISSPVSYLRDKIDSYIDLSLVDNWMGNWTVALTNCENNATGYAMVSVDKRSNVIVSGRYTSGMHFSTKTTLRQDSWGGWVSIPDSAGEFKLGLGKDRTMCIDDPTGRNQLIDFAMAGASLPEVVYCSFLDFPLEIDDCTFIPWEVPSVIRFSKSDLGTGSHSLDGTAMKYNKKKGEVSFCIKVEAIKCSGRYVDLPIQVRGIIVNEAIYGVASLRGMNKLSDVYMSTIKPTNYIDMCDSGDCNE